jgi:hypothetical protein
MLLRGLRAFFSSALDDHAGTARRAGFDFDRHLENLFQEFPLIDSGRRTYAQAFAAVQQDDLIGEFRREAEIVRDLNHSVTVFVGEAAQAAKEVDLRTDIKMQRGLVQQ